MSIADILKNVPEGTKLYSPICGECKFVRVYEGSQGIEVEYYHKNVSSGYLLFNNDGSYILGGECLLYPSKGNKDWSTFKKVPKIKTEFKPFEKVLVRCDADSAWTPDFYGRYVNGYHVCVGSSFKYCIPYEGNEHLLGTRNCPKSYN